MQEVNSPASAQCRLLRCYVADVNALTRYILTDALARDPAIVVVGQSTHEIRRSEIDGHRPDVVFVEARMGADAVAACIPPDGPYKRAWVLVSSVAADASGAFELDATDFLLRPFRPDRVAAVLAKVRRHVAGGELFQQERNLTAAPSSPAPKSEPSAARATRTDDAIFEIVTREGATYMPLSGIQAMIAAGAVTTVVTAAGNLTSIHSLVELEGRVPRGRFLRTHRRAIVNMNNVIRLEAQGDGTGLLVLTSGVSVPVARRRLALVRASLRHRAPAT